MAAVARSGLEGAGVALRSRAQAAADACKKDGFMGLSRTTPLLSLIEQSKQSEPTWIPGGT